MIHALASTVSELALKLMAINVLDLGNACRKCSHRNGRLCGCNVASRVQELTLHFLLESTIICLTIRAFRVIYGTTKRKGDQQNGNYYKR